MKQLCLNPLKIQFTSVFSRLVFSVAAISCMSFQLKSSAFLDGQAIPKEYTCDGKNVNPPLSIIDPPQGVISYVLINYDPDSSPKKWVHWILYNISPDLKEIPEAISKEEVLEDGLCQGRNNWGHIGYDGPCPPSGEHRYIFSLYALDTKLSSTMGVTKTELEKSMKGHILGKTELTGTYVH